MSMFISGDMVAHATPFLFGASCWNVLPSTAVPPPSLIPVSCNSCVSFKSNLDAFWEILDVSLCALNAGISWRALRGGESGAHGIFIVFSLQCPAEHTQSI